MHLLFYDTNATCFVSEKKCQNLHHKFEKSVSPPSINFLFLTTHLLFQEFRVDLGQRTCGVSCYVTQRMSKNKHSSDILSILYLDL